MKTVHTEFKTKESLLKAYMPFVKNGGLMVITSEEFQLDESIEVSFSLLGEPNSFVFKTKVIWISPANMQTQGGAGVKVTGSHAVSSPVFGFGSHADETSSHHAFGIGIQLAQTAGTEILKRIKEISTSI